MTRRRHRIATALAAGTALALAGCSAAGGGSGTPSAPASASPSSSSPSPTPTTPPASLTVTPALADGAVLPGAPVRVGVSGGTLTSVVVTDPTGAKVTGATKPTAGGATWTPTPRLLLGTTYSLAATAKNADGRPTTLTKSLTTLAPSATVGISTVTPQDGNEVGDAQPVVVTFTRDVQDKAAALKALSVTDTKHSTGAWRWLSDSRVDYRPRTPWPLGDVVTLRTSLTDVKVGPHQWAVGNLTRSFTVTSDLHIDVDAAAHVMTVSRGGQVVRTFPTGTGQPGLETFSGSMVVLGKQMTVHMTSCSVGLSCTKGKGDFYDELVHDTLQLTPSGTYIHAAPWDGELGRANTSHGCIHLGQSAAEWLYGQAQQGDLVTVRNTGVPLVVTNGEGDWTYSWAQWTAHQS